MDEKHDATRCKQCDHLLSFHGEDGCGTWLLGVRAVPLYRCACVVSPTKSGTKFPVISSNKFQLPPVTKSPAPMNEPTIANLPPASQISANAHANLRNRLTDVANELRRTAAELKALEDTLDTTLRRLTPNKTTEQTNMPVTASSIHDASPVHPPSETKSSNPAMEDFMDRRASNDRRRRNYAMIAERRMNDRRTVAA